MDAIVATVVLGIAMAGVMSLSAAAVRSQMLGEDLQIASMIADERLSMVVALGPEGYLAEEERRAFADEPHDSFEWFVDIEPSGARDPSFVNVAVEWQRGGRDRRVTVEALVSVRAGDEPDPDRAPEQSLGRAQ